MNMSEHDRLRHAREAAGYKTAKAAAEALGISPETYRGHENGSRGITPARAKQYARLFGVDVGWLLYGESRRGDKLSSDDIDAPGQPVRVSSSFVPVRGEVASAVWREIEEAPVESDEMVPAMPGHPPSAQSAFRVATPCMDAVGIPAGAYVVGVPYDHARAYPHSGDIVVVERRRGDLVERTVRQVYVRPDRALELRHRSTDPRYAAPLVPADLPDGETADITHYVIGIYVPPPHGA